MRCLRWREKKKDEENEIRTLGLGELALLDTDLDGLVELGVERGLRRDVDLVVVLHILLDRLTAIKQNKT